MSSLATGAIRSSGRWATSRSLPVDWLLAGLFVLASEIGATQWPALQSFPDALVLPTAGWIGIGAGWFIDRTSWLFRGFDGVLVLPLSGLQWLLHAIPWSVVVAIVILIAMRAGGRRLGLLTAAVLSYILIIGYWSQAMNTLALVLLAVPISVLVGFGLGIWAYRSRTAYRLIQPCLDLMQTVPTFAYLIPILLLFGFGAVVGIVASAIYSIPPMVHNTVLGLRQVPAEVRESGEMSGCTARQLFWLVEIPSAAKQLMVGINQTVMAVFAMVIIAAVIGGSDDIGWEVLETMRRADFGRSLLSGMVIALLAIVMDRITLGFAAGKPRRHEQDARAKLRHLLAPGLVLILVAAAAALLPALREFPTAWRYYPSAPLNDALTAFVGRYGDAMAWIKNTAIYFVFLPLRIGLNQAVSPFSWGFALTPAMIWGYWALLAGIVGALLLSGRSRSAVVAGVFGWLLYFGTTGVAWPGFFCVVLLLAWRAGGIGVCLFALFSMLFVAMSGLWDDTMQSLYLCGLAVAICFGVGGGLGVWAAHSKRVSNFLRPIQDTLQTIPQFVLLIPALMLFQVGEFTALLAIILYAIVPPIRYVEHGLRTVPLELVEAATQMGCSWRQSVFAVKIPAAMGSIMLGLNQTILFALSMLAIAALVGTQGLALDVYLALAKADAGKGLVAGLAIALVAMVADRILRASIRRRGQALGA